MTKTEKVRRYMAKHPDASNSEVAAALEVAPSTVTYARSKGPGETQPAPGATQTEITLTVPGEGLMIRLRNGTGAMGTLSVMPSGIRYRRANQKSQPDRLLRWEQFAGLMESGLLA